MKLFLLLLLNYSVLACENYQLEHIGNLQEPLLEETSGIAASRIHKDIIWAHNDSGDEARFFAFTRTGKSKGQFTIKGAGHLDWEDMAIGKCPASVKSNGSDCLFLGDIGDNPFERENLIVYIVAEPKPVKKDQIISVDLLKKYTVKLDTPARNFETMVIDGDNLILISKSDARAGKKYKEEGNSHIYQFKMGKNEKVTAKKISSFNFFDLKGFKEKDKEKKWKNYLGWLTAGDYNEKRKKLVLLTYGLIIEFDVKDWTQIKPINKPYVLPKMPQAESVTYLNDNSILVVSEYTHQPLYKIKCQ